MIETIRIGAHEARASTFGPMGSSEIFDPAEALDGTWHYAGRRDPRSRVWTLKIARFTLGLRSELGASLVESGTFVSYGETIEEASEALARQLRQWAPSVGVSVGLLPAEVAS